MAIIDWTKYVDAIYCIHFIPYKDRKVLCDEELDFMDILHSPIFKYHYTYRDNLQYIILNNINTVVPDYKNERKDLALNCILAYHSIFRESQEFGYKRILIIEDDITFVRDKDRMIDTLEHLPEEWDYIQFDKVMSKSLEPMLDTLQRGPYFHGNYTGGYWGTAFCMWGEKSFDLCIKLIEDHLIVSDWLLVNRDDDRVNNMKRFVAARHLLYQAGRREFYFDYLDKG